MIRSSRNAPNNGTISANTGYQGSKQQLCDHQSNMAFMESILPGSVDAIGGNPNFSTLNSAATAVVTDRAIDTAGNSTSFLSTVESWTGMPMSVASGILKGFGYFSTASRLTRQSKQCKMNMQHVWRIKCG